MDKFMKLVGEHSRKLRKKKGLTQEDLAELTSLTQPYIAGFESGDRNITLDSLGKIIDALGVSAIEFFGFHDVESNAQFIEKVHIIDLQKNILMNRDHDEVLSVFEITKEILKIVDNKK